MRRNIKWSAAAAAFLAVSAEAADRGNFWVAPHLGFAQARVAGQNLEFGQTEKFEGWTAGISAGYRTHFGLLAELGTSASGDLFIGWATGGELRETYAAVGYDVEFARDWHFIPKVGLTDWELKAGEFEELVDEQGNLTESLDGQDVYLELGIGREFGEHMAVGFALREADVSFGRARSAAIRFTWNF
jgi:hypothetical protein